MSAGRRQQRRGKKSRSGARSGVQGSGTEAPLPRGSAAAASSSGFSADWSFHGLVLAVFLGVSFFVYEPALDGSSISDDQHYVFNNPYVQKIDAASLVAIFDPGSVVSRYVENYAPVHLLLHAAEWKLFGDSMRGYHVVNLVVHSLASVLLAILFQRAGVGRTAAVFGAAFFLVHPANVEAVAWISQLKTTSALLLCLLALLAHPRYASGAALLFGLSLLAKPTAAVALPVALVWGWVVSPRRAAEPAAAGAATSWRWAWLGGWAVLLAVFAVAEFSAFAQTAGQAPPFYPELDVRIRSICAIALRYLVLAVSGLGTSVFHEPPPAATYGDPWFLASLVVLGLLAWRSLITLRRRSLESVYWVWAIVSFAPICGVIPLPFPMADRYLYFILPGLIGAVLCAGPELRSRLVEPARARAGPAAAVACGALLLAFASLSHARSGVWQSGNHFMEDAERHYPEGAAAMTRKAHRAAMLGDVESAVGYLRSAIDRGYNRLDHLLGDPAYGPFLHHPLFQPVLFELANEWIDRISRTERISQMELRVIAQAYIVLDELDEAEKAMLRAAEVGGPLDDKVAADLVEIRRHQRIQRGIR